MVSIKTQVLIVGATGYIGGSILSELLKSPDSSTLAISVLIRRSEQAKTFESLGVASLPFQGLDDLNACRDAASQHDGTPVTLWPFNIFLADDLTIVVINAASASHDTSAKALIEGLALRQKNTGRNAYFIHTSGTSILGDHPYTRTASSDHKIWSDEKDDIYEMEKQHPERYGQRITDVAVVEIGLSVGVKTYIVVPPTIYGMGSGPFATLSQQIPNLARMAKKRGSAAVIETGKATWNHVHMSDLSVFYLRLFRAVREQPAWLPSGPKAIFFVESGEHTWLQVSQGIADAMYKSGLLATNQVESVSLKEAAAEITKGNESLAEISLASNSRARADFGRNQLGWNTSRGLEDFLTHFDAEVEAMLPELSLEQLR
ncbi:hypothetical protein N7478_009167 [Penicillium angulare]|uniref:uncharacterized protein n=1 Tax=Penicillium angulare TaxID=116970 RepID=UPI0025408E5B|nr:uncharacterized protein N7478_009167 [Penicillium angulare]KAJ5274042.1 hypothetical protein N7478_009167 [Penicillium angulare]